MQLRILLADSQPLFRQCMRALIDQESDLAVAGEACDALELLDLADRVPCDVVCLDVRLARLNGIEATRRLIACHPKLRIIAVTDAAEWEYIRGMVVAGAVGYVSKACGREDLLAAIRGGKREQRYFCRTVTASVMRSVFEDPAAAASFDLTPREREVLKLVAEGNTSVEIASALDLSVATVRSYRTSIMRNLHLRSKVALTRYAIGNGIASGRGVMAEQGAAG
jgi:DNA-binding NarL/FixJ family response regulator